MSELATQQCEACNADAPKLTDKEISTLKDEVPEWDVAEENGEKRLIRAFQFRNFAQALDFTDKIGALAEDAGHHPALLTEWGKVTVSWWTHKIGGLHKNDFVMAATTDKAYNKMQS